MEVIRTGRKYFDDQQKLASCLGSIDIGLLADNYESRDALTRDDCLFGPFHVHNTKKIVDASTPIPPGRSMEICFYTQVGGYLTHLLVSTDELAVKAFIYDVGQNQIEIPGTRRQANISFKEGSRRVLNFDPEAKMWISEKLVLAVDNLSKDRELTPHDFGAILRIDANVNNIWSSRYDGSHFVRNNGKYDRISPVSG